MSVSIGILKVLIVQNYKPSKRKEIAMISNITINGVVFQEQAKKDGKPELITSDKDVYLRYCANRFG